MTIQILIADDEKLIRRGLRMFLSLHPELKVVGEAANGEEAIALAVDLQPDVILMDLLMPKVNGIEATLRLRESQSPAKIIGLSNSYDYHMIHAAIIAGVDTFLSKDTSPDKMVTTIESIVQGVAVLPETPLHKLFHNLPPRDMNMLSTDDKMILNLLTSKASDNDIADELQLDVKRVRQTIHDMQDRLHVNSRLLLVLYDLKIWSLGEG